MIIPPPRAFGGSIATTNLLDPPHPAVLQPPPVMAAAEWMVLEQEMDGHRRVILKRNVRNLNLYFRSAPSPHPLPFYLRNELTNKCNNNSKLN